MPVTMRYSAALDQTYEESDPQSSSSSSTTSSSNLAVTPIAVATGTNGNGSGGGGGFESPASPSSHCSPSSLHSRTSSTDSLDDSVGSGGHSRQLSSDSTEFIPTRTVKTNAKPAFNPLQFVKTGAAPLYKKAVQQVKQYEDVRKVKEMVKEEEEAWQSNLDNWKSKRRQISSHTIQRAEEIKQIEEVEHSRQRKKSKTFSEMMEERSKRRPSSVKLPVYNNENVDDFGDNSFDFKDEERQEECSKDSNGIAEDTNAACSKLNASFESSGSDQVFNDDEEEPTSHSERAESLSRKVNSKGITSESRFEGRIGINGKDKNGATNGCNGDTTPSEEYTFEKAIRSYAEYAESRNKTSRTSQSSETGEQTSFASPSSFPTDSSRNDGAGSYRDVDDTFEDVRAPMEVVRRDGEQLSAVVCLKRGGDCKDFGFTSKSIKGIGTGIFVESVHVGSPAENAGLKVDDEILSINGECTSNRSHSAIVFAIKQAVYTGYLELQIYRYNDTDFLYVQQPLSRGSLFGMKVSGNGTSNIVDGPVRRRETSPKVDVMKRRSLFEGSSVQSNDKRLNRRSLDLNNSHFKDKLASFENLETAEQQQHNTDRSKHTPERDLTFKKKLASFKSMDSLDGGGRSEHQLTRPSVLSVNVNVKHKLSSFENLNDGNYRHSERTKESPVRERGALFDKWQSFERTKSCDHLDRYGSDEVVTPVDYDVVVTNVTSTEPPITSVPLLERSASDYDSKISSSFLTMPLMGTGIVDMLDMVDVDADVSIADETNDVRLTREVETMKGIVGFRSGFELADSLEETPIVGSQPSSPVTTRAEFDYVDYGGHCQIDELAMTENWLTHSEPILSKDCERLQTETLPSVDSESSRCHAALSKDVESIQCDPTLPKDSESGQCDPALSKDSESVQCDPTLSKDSECSQSDLGNSKEFESEHKELTLSNDSENSQIVNFEDVLVIDDNDDDDDLHDVLDGDEDVDISVRKLVPPKEKPPPPPIELENTANNKSVTVRRISSTKRIRKEIWRRRSDFLGIDADGVEDYIEKEIKNVSPPPKMEEFLLEEKQLTEQCLQDQLTRRREHENEYLVSPTTPYRVVFPIGAVTHTEANHEDEIARKEREIIEDLEREEQQCRGDMKTTDDTEVSERSEEDARLEAERVESEEILRLDEERTLKEREELLSCQEERLRLEKEKLRKEQEDLLREKEAYQKQIEEHQRYNPLTAQHPNPSLHQGSPTNGQVSPEPKEVRSRLPPPPPPVKPKLSSPRSMEYMDGIPHRNSPPSSSIAALQQPIHLQIDDDTKPYNSVASPILVPLPPVSKSKQVLHALSASPRAKLVDSEQWLAKRKSNNSRNYNQQHWLVQEAEMRRILEQRQLQHQQQQQRLPTVQPQQQQQPPPNSDWPAPTSPKVAPTAFQHQSSNGSPSNYVQQLPIAHNHSQLQQAPRMRPSVAPPLNTHHTHNHHHHHHNHHNTQPIYGQTTVGRLLPPPPLPPSPPPNPQQKTSSTALDGGSVAKSSPERDPHMLSVSGKKKCSHCAQELGRGAAMIIESLQLFYHIQCFQCCVCHVQLGNGTSGADVRVRNQKLHCHNCYSNDEGLKFSKV